MDEEGRFVGLCLKRNLLNQPFTIKLQEYKSKVTSEPVVISGWSGSPTRELWRPPSSAAISASGKSCADAALLVELDGVTPLGAYAFSAVKVELQQSGRTGELLLTDWMVTADDTGKAQGSVKLADFSHENGITCADLAADTSIDVKATLTAALGGVVDDTTSLTFPLYDISVDPVAEGTVACDPTVAHGGEATCSITDIQDGYAFDILTLDPAGAATLSCTTSATPIECKLSGVTGKLTVRGVFKLPPPPSGAAAVPTLGEAGLLFSSLALAGAAAPAIRRRRERSKKADALR